MLLCRLCLVIKLTVLLLCACVHSDWKGSPEMTCTVSDGTLNHTHSLTFLVRLFSKEWKLLHCLQITVNLAHQLG